VFSIGSSGCDLLRGPVGSRMCLNYLKCCFNKPFCRALPLPDLTFGSREADLWRRRLHHQAFRINNKTKPKHAGLTLQTPSLFCTHLFFYIVFMMNDTSNPRVCWWKKCAFTLLMSANLQILHADHEKSMVGSFHLSQ